MESKQACEIMFISLNWLKFSMLMLNLYARTFRFGFTFVMGSLHQLLQKKNALLIKKYSGLLRYKFWCLDILYFRT